MKKLLSIAVVALLAWFVSGCASTYNEVGRQIAFQPGKVGLGSTKVDVYTTYGKPTKEWMIGELSGYNYAYVHQQVKHDRTIAQGFGSILTGGLSDLFVDHGVRQSDLKEDVRELYFVFDQTDRVVDFRYRDSQGNGHDESETMYLKSVAAYKKGDLQEAVRCAKQAVDLNQNNHRALNGLAWAMGEMGMDPKAGVAYGERAIRLWRYDPDYWKNLGVSQMKVGDLTGARVSLEQASRLYKIYKPKEALSLAQVDKMLESVNQQAAKKR